MVIKNFSVYFKRFYPDQVLLILFPNSQNKSLLKWKKKFPCFACSRKRARNISNFISVGQFHVRVKLSGSSWQGIAINARELICSERFSSHFSYSFLFLSIEQPQMHPHDCSRSWKKKEKRIEHKTEEKEMLLPLCCSWYGEKKKKYALFGWNVHIVSFKKEDHRKL